jgi:hypothetical protein
MDSTKPVKAHSPKLKDSSPDEHIEAETNELATTKGKEMYGRGNMPETEWKLLIERLKLLGLTPLQLSRMSENQVLERADKEIKRMLLEAVAIKKWDLRHSSEKVRRETASEVIAMNGMDRKDSIVAGGGSIVINVGNGQAPAWFKTDPAVRPQPTTDADSKK